MSSCSSPLFLCAVHTDELKTLKLLLIYMVFTLKFMSIKWHHTDHLHARRHTHTYKRTHARTHTFDCALVHYTNNDEYTLIKFVYLHPLHNVFTIFTHLFAEGSSVICAIKFVSSRALLSRAHNKTRLLCSENIRRLTKNSRLCLPYDVHQCHSFRFVPHTLKASSKLFNAIAKQMKMYRELYLLAFIHLYPK